MCRRGQAKQQQRTAHESWRARCEDDCFVTHRHKLEPWDTRENLTCVEVLNVRGVGVVFTHPSLTRESLLPVNETPCNWDSFEKKSLCIPTPCLPPSVWWLPPWRRRAWWGCGRIPFPSSFLGRLVQFLQWILRTVDSLFAALVCWDGVWSFLLQTLRTTALWFWWLRRSLHVVPSDRFYLGCGVPIHNCFHVFYVLLRCTRMYDLLWNFVVVCAECFVASNRDLWLSANQTILKSFQYGVISLFICIFCRSVSCVTNSLSLSVPMARAVSWTFLYHVLWNR